MRPKAILEALHFIEKKVPVHEWTVNGVHLWPMVRFQLETYFYYSAVETLSKSDKKGFVHVLKEQIFLCFDWVLNGIQDSYSKLFLNFSDKKADIVALTDGYQFRAFEGVLKDILVDPIRQGFESKKNRFLFLTVFRKKILNKFSKVFLVPPYLFFESIVYKRRYFKSADTHFPGFLEYQQGLKDLGAVSFSLYSKHSLIKLGLTIDFYKQYFIKKIISAETKLGLVVSYYAPLPMGFVAACRQLGISSVDVQHGVISQYHSAYAQFLQVPQNGFNTMPNLFLSWKPSDADCINQWASSTKVHKAIAVGPLGHLSWQQHKHAYFKQASYQAFLNLFKEKTKEGCKHILVTLQPLMPSQLNVLAQVIRDSGKQYFWWIRLHPLQSQDMESVLQCLGLNHSYQNNVNLELATTLNLYAVLEKVDIHITYSSSTVIEASILNIPSIVIHEDGAQYYAQEIKEGSAFLATKATDIEHKLAQLCSEKKTVSEYAFEPWPLERIVEFLQTVSKGESRDT